MPGCLNYMNQEAIDQAIRENNYLLGETLYREGKNCCIQCDYGLGLETDPNMLLMKAMLGEPIKRICYKSPEK